jgi:hypothetical protein
VAGESSDRADSSVSDEQGQMAPEAAQGGLSLSSPESRTERTCISKRGRACNVSVPVTVTTVLCVLALAERHVILLPRVLFGGGPGGWRSVRVGWGGRHHGMERCHRIVNDYCTQRVCRLTPSSLPVSIRHRPLKCLM